MSPENTQYPSAGFRQAQPASSGQESRATV